MNEIDWKPKAVRQLEKIKDRITRQKIYLETQSLIDFPDCQGVKKLTNHEYSYRLRVGDFRVFFEFDGNVHIISIEEVKKHDDRTY